MGYASCPAVGRLNDCSTWRRCEHASILAGEIEQLLPALAIGHLSDINDNSSVLFVTGTPYYWSELPTETLQVDRRTDLERQIADIDSRIAKLTEAIEMGGQLAVLIDKIKRYEQQRAGIIEELATLHAIPRLEPRVVEDRLSEWRRLLRGSTTQARAVLQRLLAGRLTFDPQADGSYTFSGETRFDRLFSGVAFTIAAPAYAAGDVDPGAATYPVASQTFDPDYGRLLERVFGRNGDRKRLASPAGFEPAFWP
jgi:hypothetical protein